MPVSEVCVRECLRLLFRSSLCEMFLFLNRGAVVVNLTTIMAQAS